MSRNARDNENGRFDIILSNQVNVHEFDDFVEFQSNLLRQNQFHRIDDFNKFLVKFFKAKSAWRIQWSDKFLPFSLQHAFLDISLHLKIVKAYLFYFEIILEKYLLLGEVSVNSLHCAVFSTFLCDMIWRVKWIIGWKLVQFVLNSSFYLIAWIFFSGTRQASFLITLMTMKEDLLPYSRRKILWR